MSATGGGRQAAPESGMRLGARVAVGATALAAALGVGAFVITDHLTKKEPSSTLGAPDPVESPDVVASDPADPHASASASTPAVPKEVRESIEAARTKAAEDGVPLARPIPQKAPRPVTDLARTTAGSLKSGGIVRVVSARGDLTGQQELAWVAGGITKYAGSECSQTFRFSTNPQPARKPNLLLCWRTSTKKSVVAIVVDPQGKPSKEKAVSALEERWRSMK